MRTEVRRQDRPWHVGETARKEWRCQFDDMMLRLEPGDIVGVALAADLAETDKGVHLVLVAAHRFCHRRDGDDVGIGRDLQKVMAAAQSPQPAVKDCKPLSVTAKA